MVAAADRKDGSYNIGDLVRCEVIEFSADKVTCGMKGVHQSADKSQSRTFGLVSKEQLPLSYRYLSSRFSCGMAGDLLVCLDPTAELSWNRPEGTMRNAWRAIALTSTRAPSSTWAERWDWTFSRPTRAPCWKDWSNQSSSAHDWIDGK